MNGETMQTVTSPIKVLIADDHPLFREALALQRQKYGNTHILVSLLLYELGSVRNSLGDLDGAAALFQETSTDGWVTLHSSAARVKFSVRVMARK